MRLSVFSVVLSVLVAGPVLGAGPVLRIGGVEVSPAQFAVATSAVQMARGGRLEHNQVVRQAVDQLVVREVLAAAARDAKIVVDPAKVQAALAQQKAQEGPERFAKMLADTGLTEPELADLEAKRQLIKAFIDAQIAPGVSFSEQEAKAYYDGHPQQFTKPDRVKLRMIAAELPPNPDEAKVAEVKMKIDTAYKRLQAGEDFAKVAAEMSSHPTREKGGEVGLVPRGGMPAEIEASYIDLKAGTFTTPIRTPAGFVIFKVDERVAASTDSFDAIKERLTRFLREQKVNEAVQRYAAARSASIRVEVVDPAIRAALDATHAGAAPAGGSQPPAPTKP